MFAAMLFAISIIALSQFGIFYWRAILSGVAAQPVSARVLESANVDAAGLSAQHFPVMSKLHELTADLHPGTGGLGVVRFWASTSREWPRGANVSAPFAPVTPPCKSTGACKRTWRSARRSAPADRIFRYFVGDIL